MRVQAFLGFDRQTATIRLIGDLDADTVPLLRSLLDQATAVPIVRVVLHLAELSSMSAACVRSLVSAQQTLGPEIDLVLTDVRPEVRRVLGLAAFDHVAARSAVG